MLQVKQEQETLEEEEEEEEDESADDQVENSSSGDHVNNQCHHTTVVIIEKQQADSENENSEPMEESLSDNAGVDVNESEEDVIPPMYLCRRHSLPPPQVTGRESLFTSLRRDSYPRHLSRRYSLPVGELPNSNSFDKLVEKLSSLVESSPTNGTHFDYDQRPRIVSISQSLDAKTLSRTALEASRLTSAHGLDPVLLAHRPYTSEPHIAMLAHQYKLNNRLGNLAYLAKNLSVAGIMPRLQTVNQKSEDCIPATSRQSLPSLTSLPTSGVRLALPGHTKATLDSRPSRGQTMTTSTKDTIHKVEHRLSLGDTSRGDDHNTERKPLMVATHSVDAIYLSGEYFIIY